MSSSRLRGLLLAALVQLALLVPSAGAAPSELFFSEYIEGSSNNKALEIYNGTGAAIDLGTAGYNVQMFFNGNPVSTLTINLAGTFTPTDDLMADSTRAEDLNTRLVERTKAKGGLRADIEVDDLSLILEQVASLRLGDERRTRQLRRRYLALFLAGLRNAGEPLPGPPPAPMELASRWSPEGRR